MVLFVILTAVTLSQCTSILGCGWPRSSRVDLKIIPSWQLRKNAPNFASAADATTNRKIEHSVWKAPFLLSVMGFPSTGQDPRKKWLHALLRDWVHLGTTHPSGCSTPCRTLKTLLSRWGVLPSNQVLGMLFTRYVPFLLFVHLQWYLTPITPSYLPPSCSKVCCPQLSAPV